MVKKGIKRTLAQARGRQDRAQNQMLKELAKDVNQLKASVEKKFSYLGTEGVGIQSWDPTDSNSRGQNIFPIRVGTTQGIKDTERIGDVINIKSINFRYTLNMANGSVSPADPFNRIRVVMFWDTDPISTTTTGQYILDTPEWNLIFQTPNLLTAQGSNLVMISPKDHDTGKRFQLLHDKVHTLCSNENMNLPSAPNLSLGLGARSCSGVEYVNKSYKIGRKLQYVDGGTTPNNRQLYIGFISDSFDVVNPIADFVIKVNYEDA